MNWREALASRAEIPVFAAIGARMLHHVDDLFLQSGVTRVASAREASVLLVAGELRDADLPALRRVHDQMPHPRATLWWQARPIGQAGDAPGCTHTEEAATVARQLREIHELLLRTPTKSEPDWLPDEPPAPWRGIGEHGQGGEGMMGGNPYGRPMAMTADDLRDGLQLDAFTLRIGPFALHLPPGLVLQFQLQGDVIQEATVCAPPHLQEDSHAPLASREPAARVLELLELPAFARRCRANASNGDESGLAALHRTLRRCGVFAAIPPDLGRAAANQPDVRERLAASLRGGAPAEEAGTDIPALLRGLEWQEAMLIVASMTPGAFASGARP